MPHLEFIYEPLKAIASIELFLISEVPELTRGKISKLMFLADKLHLVQFGRTITGDRYAALPHGPIPSKTCDLMDAFESDNANVEGIQELGVVAKLDRRFTYPHYYAAQPELVMVPNELSESDIAALREIVVRYGKLSFSELRGLTHEMPAYENAWQRKKLNAALMHFEEFFEQDEQAIVGVLEDALENQAISESLGAKVAHAG